MDQDVEHEETGGCMQSVSQAITGLIFAPILMIGGAALLFWNEGRAVQRARDLDQGRRAVVETTPAKVDPELEGKLVHLQGKMEIDSKLEDELTGVRAEAVRLERLAQMYQWVENEQTQRKKRNGETVETTTYTYEKKWVSTLQDSGMFHETEGHRNPDSMPYDSRDMVADPVRVGGYVLNREMIDRVEELEPLTLDQSIRATLPDQHRSSASIQGNTIYLDGRTSAPKIGDVRLQYHYQPPEMVSVVAAQNGESLAPYTSPKLNGRIGLIETGRHSAKALFEQAETRNLLKTWGFRVGGWLLVVIAFSMLFGPLEAAAGAVPLVGGIVEDFVEFGTTIVAGVLGSALALMVVSVGWIVYRPVVGGLLLVGGAALLAGIVYAAMKLSSRETAVG